MVFWELTSTIISVFVKLSISIGFLMVVETFFFYSPLINSLAFFIHSLFVNFIPEKNISLRDLLKLRTYAYNNLIDDECLLEKILALRQLNNLHSDWYTWAKKLFLNNSVCWYCRKWFWSAIWFDCQSLRAIYIAHVQSYWKWTNEILAPFFPIPINK
jgi:hypothetical protein